ncbi:hypothetical protein KFL_001910020 [Klebsormidium nitens]|uniref:Uncharacterized protein n=1 Tax=Klebsormidium nitens TaxID=105231 RepID=A0A1Y1I1Y2_KLENI|nr:hypothetical protein KFL_001910020 [Klebsormidium nitens]|eukprot:GAQ84483.1 hypothetical protein KFL_001910020 [Klebsormidium nitens]
MSTSSPMQTSSPLKPEIATCADLSPPELQALAERLADQLRKDEETLSKGGIPSPLAMNMPRKGTAIDKQTRLAHLVAHSLWPPRNEAEEIWSLIKYGQLISTLSKVVKGGWRKAEAERLALKHAPRVHMDRGAFCTLKTRGVSRAVREPRAMPVALTDAAEFRPFFDFLKADQVPWSNTNPDPGARVEFPRGIFYSDGRMDLCKQVVGPGSIGPLMDCLRHNSHIRHFLLGNNVIGPAGARAISEFIAQNESVITWYLAGNCIDVNGVARLAAALAENDVVEALWLKRNPIGPVGARHVAEMLTTNVRLHTLDLDNCGLLDDGVVSLVAGFKANDTLRHLYLSANGITPAGAVALGEYFTDCSTKGKAGLESLYLSVNRIGDSGAAALAKGLRSNRGLKRLVVSSNQIEAAGAAALCDALTGHQTLEVLDLGVYTSTADMGELPNRIEDAGAAAVARLIRTNPKLVYVNVAHNGLTRGGWGEVVGAAIDSPSLVHLDAVERGLRKEPHQQRRLAEQLERNILGRYGISRAEFLRTELKFVRQPDNVRYIESLYRTRDFQNRGTRRGVKKFWDEGDETLKMVAMSA